MKPAVEAEFVSSEDRLVETDKRCLASNLTQHQYTYQFIGQLFLALVYMLCEFLFHVWHRHEIDIVEKHVGCIRIFQGNVSQYICWVIRLQQLVKPNRHVVKGWRGRAKYKKCIFFV